MLAKIISQMYTTGRKFNLRVYCAVTSLSALERTFPHGAHHDVLGQSGVIHVLAVSDPHSSGFVKDMGGEKRAVSVSTSSSSSSGGTHGGSTSSSSSRTPHGVPVIRPEMVRAVPRTHQTVLLDGCPYLIYAEKRSFLDVPEHRARAGENPFWKEGKDAKPAPLKPPKKPKVDEVSVLMRAYGS